MNLDNEAHIGITEFIKINWLPIKERVAQCICVNVFKFFNEMSPQYIWEIFTHLTLNTIHLCPHLNWTYPFDKAALAKKNSHLGPKTWNNLLTEIKLSRNVNTFKHSIKKLFFNELQKQNDNIFFYY